MFINIPPPPANPEPSDLPYDAALLRRTRFVFMLTMLYLQ